MVLMSGNTPTCYCFLAHEKAVSSATLQAEAAYYHICNQDDLVNRVISP